MFVSQKRPYLAVPQLEHARLAGLLALHWGNDIFKRPPLEWYAFVHGVTMHDRGYGFFDNAALDKMPVELWMEIQRQGLEYDEDDAVADIVALLHVRRLIEGAAHPGFEQLLQLADTRIDTRLADTSHELDLFLKADRITHACDMMAFMFSYERAYTGTVNVYRTYDTDDTIDLTFRTDGNGTIVVNPWPFEVPDFSGFILGYNRKHYPEMLDPIILPYMVQMDYG